MFSVTLTASQEILAAAQRSDAAGMALRVAARQVADGSIEYGMGFDEVREDDDPIEFGGLKVVIGSPSGALLSETVLDYVEIAPGKRDFVFREPAATQAAPRGGCGSGGCGNCGA